QQLTPAQPASRGQKMRPTGRRGGDAHRRDFALSISDASAAISSSRTPASTWSREADAAGTGAGVVARGQERPVTKSWGRLVLRKMGVGVSGCLNQAPASS